jgi:hypothetical protein
VSTWAWVAIGLATFFLLSTFVTLAVATILGRVGREVSELLDSAAWSSAPLAREQAEDERVPLEDVPSRRVPDTARQPSQRSEATRSG